MKIILTIIVLAVNSLYQVSGQIDTCQYANNYRSYSMCQSGQVACNSGGCSTNGVQCPYGSSYYNGQCLGSSVITCPSGSVLSNGQCVSQAPVQCAAGSTYSNGVCVTCPTNSSLINGICYADQICDASNNFCNQGTTVASCPQGYTMSNGSCVEVNITCTGDSFPYNGQCAVCPPNSIYIDGACSTCAPGTTRSVGGTCDCPTGTVWSNGNCVIEGSSCGQDESLVNGICMKCFDGECCKSTFCNDCFLYCDQYNIGPNSNSSCRAACIKNEIPFEQKVSENIVSDKGNDTKFTNLANFTNTISISNIVNSTNTHNVITNINNTNINNINLGSKSNSVSSVKGGSSDSRDQKQCCIIIDAHKCSQRADKKWECIERRHHLCGAQCFYDDYTPEAPLDVEPEPTIEEYPVYVPVPQFYREPPAYIPPPQVQIIPQLQQPTYAIVQQQGCQFQEQAPFVNCENNYGTDCQQCVNTGAACPTICQQG